MIRVNGVSKTFGSGEAATRALRGISFEIAQGETVAITGPSGCGKTTLLHILAGIERMDEGEVWLGDSPIHQLSENKLSELRLRKMGFVFQSYHLVPVLRAWENAAVPLLAAGISQKEAKERALEALGQVGLANWANHYPGQLSGGQNQRVAIARAIVGKPELLWADEPTGALDTDTAEQIVGLLEMLNRHLGTTLVIVTHDPRLARRAERTLRMVNGRLLHEGGKES
ncbi:ABC transporter ATP-binding protein [Paenibacillus aurantiacus]|uniref:ABC transporter ATP-binding protein n=1 Tax=Paenibacillus aurantiacus TaxID=1936118 RepID=A0ABV5KT24_9BACL